MKLNKELYEKYADKLLAAMRVEKLMNKEVAEIFDVPASYLSNLPKHPEKLSQSFVEKIRTWSISGKPLREYKLPETPDTEAAAINQQEADEARNTAELKFRSKLAAKRLAKEHRAEMAAVVADSVNTEDVRMTVTPVDEYGEPTTTDTGLRREIAAELRKEYERQQPDSEMKITAHKNGKVDVSRLDPRTGQIAAVEMQIDERGTLTLTYTFKQ